MLAVFPAKAGIQSKTGSLLTLERPGPRLTPGRRMILHAGLGLTNAGNSLMYL